jgi:hypothetical protein
MSKELLTIAKKEYSTADTSTRIVLEKIFGKAELEEFDWRSITTPEAAFTRNGVKAEDIIPYANPKTPKQEWLNALSTMDEIIRAINPGFKEKIDWTDTTQYKWISWFKYYKQSSGFRFDDSDCDYVYSYSAGGSRLCSEDEEKNKFIAETFIDIWNIILLK